MSFGSPDAVFIQGLLQQNRTDIGAVSLILHEWVEFEQWTVLGTPFEDMLNASFLQAHYPAMYPMVHSLAVKAELNIVGLFAAVAAHKPDIPHLAFALTQPLLLAYLKERLPNSSAVGDCFSRLKYNPKL